MHSLSMEQAKRIWIRAQKLDQREPFGKNSEAVKAAVEHLGYVQIDTIHVIERCHHHILFTRIPQYKREDLRKAQSEEKSIFEYWTHALSLVPTKDYPFFASAMKRTEKNPGSWFQSVTKEEWKKVFQLVKKEGPISIREINDDELKEKKHPWASKKPSKKALELGFYTGKLVVSERIGMLKKYDLTCRHFGWKAAPKAVSEKQRMEYQLSRALRSQGIVSLDSICHLNPKLKPGLLSLIQAHEKTGALVPVKIQNAPMHWARPETLIKLEQPSLVHILSPFDPLTIQRKRLKQFFGYDHKFEAYLPKEKRRLGYFALPVLLEDRIVAVIDLKTDRAQKKLLMQKWTWLEKSARNKLRIESELDRFEKFQLEG